MAARFSFPGGLDVLILIRSASQLLASLAIDTGSGEALTALTGVGCGIPCAATGELPAMSRTAVPAMTCTARFRFTNPPSSRNRRRSALNHGS